jgi:hypothetical protein
MWALITKKEVDIDILHYHHQTTSDLCIPVLRKEIFAYFRWIPLTIPTLQLIHSEQLGDSVSGTLTNL